MGPVAGAWALGLHSTGSLARLFGDALDNAPRQPQVAIAQAGGSTAVVASYATIPLALNDAMCSGRLKKGNLVLLASVGAGFTVGAVLLRWGI